jgi:hypothetical protein
VESEAVVEAVEAAPSDEDRTTKPVAIVVIRIRVSVTVVARVIIVRPVGVVVAVRIAATDHSGRAGIIAIAVCIAVRVAVVVGVDVAVMVGVDDGRRAGGGEWR